MPPPATDINEKLTAGLTVIVPERMFQGRGLSKSRQLGDYLLCGVVNNACIFASGRNRIQLTFKLIHFASAKRIECKIIAAPCAEISHMELRHISRRFFKDNAFAANQAPPGTLEGVIQQCSNV